MIEAMIQGTLFSEPQRRTSRNGNPFTTARVRVSDGETSHLVNAIVFDDQAQAALAALGVGEAIALAGSIKVGTWTNRDGLPRPSLDMTASSVMSVYTANKKRRAASQQPAARQPARLERGHHDDQLDDGQPLDF